MSGVDGTEQMGSEISDEVQVSTYFLGGRLTSSEMGWQSGGEVPWKQFLQTIDWMTGDAFEDVARIEFWIESIELCGAEQAIDRSSAVAASVGSSKETVFMPKATLCKARSTAEFSISI